VVGGYLRAMVMFQVGSISSDDRLGHVTGILLALDEYMPFGDVVNFIGPRALRLGCWSQPRSLARGWLNGTTLAALRKRSGPGPGFRQPADDEDGCHSRGSSWWAPLAATLGRNVFLLPPANPSKGSGWRSPAARRCTSRPCCWELRRLGLDAQGESGNPAWSPCAPAAGAWAANPLTLTRANNQISSAGPRGRRPAHVRFLMLFTPKLADCRMAEGEPQRRRLILRFRPRHGWRRALCNWWI